MTISCLIKTCSSSAKTIKIHGENDSDNTNYSLKSVYHP